MSGAKSDTCLPKLVRDCKQGVVKNLIVEFEQLRVKCGSVHPTMLKMGVEQSAPIKQQGKPRTASLSGTSLVKQRVSQFSTNLDSDNNLKIGSNSTSKTLLKSVPTKTYERSKSYDYVRREKDYYRRSRQITPTVDENVFTFETPQQETVPTRDSNNNTAGKKISRRTPVQEKMREKNVIVNRRRQEFENSAKPENTDQVVTCLRAEGRAKGTIRSVKSIKRVFEKSEKTPVVAKRLEPIPDTVLTANDNDDPNKNTPIDNDILHYGETVNSLKFEDVHSSVVQTDSNEFYNNLQDNSNHITEENICDTTSDVENIKNILEEFSEVDKECCVDINPDQEEDEFNKIESCFQEVEQTLEEINLNRSCTSLNIKDQETSDVGSNENLDELEHINIYICRTSDEELEDEFGKRSFSDSDLIYFPEAYNRDGDALIITSVAGVEHRSIGESSTNTECLDDQLEDTVFLSTEIQDKDCISAENNILVLNNSVEDDESRCSGDLQETDSEINSGRSTLYFSTTTNSSESLDIYSKSESEEGIEFEKEEICLQPDVEMRIHSSGGYDDTIKTETVNNGLCKNDIDNAESSVIKEAESAESLSTPSGVKPKKDYLIEELIETEKNYIKHLGKVVHDYMPVITNEPLPPHLLGRSRYLFGNIKKIYYTTQSFYKALKRCGTDHEAIAKTFINFKYLFELYPIYVRNKPRADRYLLEDFKDVIAAQEKKLNDRLGLASNLLMPVQRIGKYILFLIQIEKELTKNGQSSANINAATEIVQKEMSRGNDYIAIDLIKQCPFSLLEQGSILLRKTFTVLKPRKYEAEIFLFEKMLVFTVLDLKDQDRFIYKDSIKLNEMGIVTFDDQPLIFHLRRFPSYKTGAKEVNEFVIEAKKEKDKKEWTAKIEKHLWEQLIKCKEQEKEMHSHQGKRTSTTELPRGSRRGKLEYSSLPTENRKEARKTIFYYKIDRDA